MVVMRMGMLCGFGNLKGRSPRWRETPSVGYGDWDWSASAGQALLASPEMNSAKPLDKQDWRRLAPWAAQCAERGLPFFEEKHPQDD